MLVFECHCHLRKKFKKKQKCKQNMKFGLIFVIEKKRHFMGIRQTKWNSVELFFLNFWLENDHIDKTANCH